MYHGLPIVAPVAASDFSEPPAMIAIPKLMRAWRLSSTITFEGLMSRWTSPLACANSSPLRMSRTFFFFKQKTAYDIGLGIPAEPLFRSPSRWTPLALSVFLHCVVALLLTLL